jgi:hypothetical protein
MAKDQYVAVLGSEEEFGEFDPIVRNRDHEYEKKALAERLIRRLGLTTERNDPKTIKVAVFSLQIVKGKMERRSAGSYDVQPSLKRMTSDEYNAEMKEILADLPEEFHGFISHTAYEDGHSSGYEEVVQIARSLAHDLLPCVKNYTKKLKTPA